MRVSWWQSEPYFEATERDEWQGGLLLEPDSQEECRALQGLQDFFSTLGQAVSRRPVIHQDDKQSVSSPNILCEDGT